VAPVATIGFRLLPCGFFDGNPAMDLPPAGDHCG
jgi:primary-amine oxidase